MYALTRMFIDRLGPREANLSDPERLAIGVRWIAVEAHRVLSHPHASSRELREICRCIDELRRETRSTPLIGVDRWLELAGERVRSRGLTFENEPQGSANQVAPSHVAGRPMS
jgi:hypothetical protein